MEQSKIIDTLETYHGSRDIPLSAQISTTRHTSNVLKSLKTQSDKITSKGKLNPLQESIGGEIIIVRQDRLLGFSHYDIMVDKLL